MSDGGWILLCAVLIGAVAGLISLPLSRKKQSPQTVDQLTSKVIDLEDIEAAHHLPDPEEGEWVVVVTFRQSGDAVRTEEFDTIDQAMAHVKKMFRRMKEDQVRIWENTDHVFDIRRPYGSSRGTRESRKIWGVSIQVINTYE